MDWYYVHWPLQRCCRMVESDTTSDRQWKKILHRMEAMGFEIVDNLWGNHSWRQGLNEDEEIVSNRIPAPNYEWLSKCYLWNLGDYASREIFNLCIWVQRNAVAHMRECKVEETISMAVGLQEFKVWIVVRRLSRRRNSHAKNRFLLIKKNRRPEEYSPKPQINSIRQMKQKLRGTQDRSEHLKSHMRKITCYKCSKHVNIRANYKAQFPQLGN